MTNYDYTQNESAVTTPGSSGSFLSSLINGLLIILFAAFMESTLVIIFFSSISDKLAFPPMFGYSSRKIKEFMSSVFPTLIISGLLLLILILIVLHNRKHIRRLFLTIGIAVAVSGLASAVLSILCPVIINALPDMIRDILYETPAVLGNLLQISSVILFIAASVFISVYLVIRQFRREVRT